MIHNHFITAIQMAVMSIIAAIIYIIASRVIIIAYLYKWSSYYRI